MVECPIDATLLLTSLPVKKFEQNNGINDDIYDRVSLMSSLLKNE